MVYAILNFNDGRTIMKNENAGYSLTEIILAMVLIAVIVITSLQFLIYCDNFAMKADTKITAEHFAREAMEEFYQKQYTDPALTSNSNVSFPGAIFDKFYSLRGGRISRTVGPEETDNVTNTKYKVITVTVTWN